MVAPTARARRIADGVDAGHERPLLFGAQPLARGGDVGVGGWIRHRLMMVADHDGWL